MIIGKLHQDFCINGLVIRLVDHERASGVISLQLVIAFAYWSTLKASNVSHFVSHFDIILCKSWTFEKIKTIKLWKLREEIRNMLSPQLFPLFLFYHHVFLLILYVITTELWISLSKALNRIHDLRPLPTSWPNLTRVCIRQYFWRKQLILLGMFVWRATLLV